MSPTVRNISQDRGLGLAIWANTNKMEDMMFISHKVTGGVNGLFTALGNPNGRGCKGTACHRKLVWISYIQCQSKKSEYFSIIFI